MTTQAPSMAPLPMAPAPLPQKPVKPAVTDPTEIDLTEKPKQIGFGDDKRELRKLSPEEKSRRRVIKNAFWLVMGLIVLIVMTAILLRAKP